MRAFLALEVSPEVRENLMKAEEELRVTRADLKLVEKENLHFTVKFLGELTDNAVEDVDKRLKGLVLRRMTVWVRGLGVFPDPRRPRVIWAGVAPQDTETISVCGQQVIDALEGIGESDERGFRPHVTLARVRSPRNREALASTVRDNASKDYGRTAVDWLKLKSSSLTPSGPTYRDVREYALQ